ncbi:D-alanyl-D-alanine carboxypeptidase [Saprospiraceae bacterium]|nr:D-alanyl-D-alanine carboxypeptidase [Saprospiraceae bacterium]
MNLSVLPSNISFLFLLCIFLATSCRSKKNLVNITQKKTPTSVQEFIEGSEVLKNSFSGFALYDPEKEEMLYQHNADKYFTPASNTKIFTLYTALELLGDSIPALKYIVKNDSLIFWGTADPSFLNPQTPENKTIMTFLKKRTEKLFFASSNFQDKRYGAGWAWDDFGYSYQSEKSPFPIHGNLVRFKSQLNGNGVDISPKPFETLVFYNPQIGGTSIQIRRKEFENIFEYNQIQSTDKDFEKDIPFHYSNEFFVELMSIILEKNVELLPIKMTIPENVKTIYSVQVDEIYEPLMQESDNFMAEQILLTCSNEVFDTMNTQKIIRFFTKEYLKESPDQPLWRDGSGLSRYNLFTPQTMIFLLNKIYKKIPEERIFNIFPTGKKQGTIKDWYAPFVHAKTGTLSNKHCLSGYITTRKEKTLLFSFMHNNYITSSTPLKEEMQKILNFIHMKY